MSLECDRGLPSLLKGGFSCHLPMGHPGVCDYSVYADFTQEELESMQTQDCWFAARPGIKERAEAGDPAALAEIEAAGYCVGFSLTGKAGIRKFHSTGNFPEYLGPLKAFLSEPGQQIDPALWRKAN